MKFKDLIGRMLNGSTLEEAVASFGGTPQLSTVISYDEENLTRKGVEKHVESVAGYARAHYPTEYKDYLVPRALRGY